MNAKRVDERRREKYCESNHVRRVFDMYIFHIQPLIILYLFFILCDVHVWVGPHLAVINGKRKWLRLTHVDNKISWFWFINKHAISFHSKWRFIKYSRIVMIGRQINIIIIIAEIYANIHLLSGPVEQFRMRKWRCGATRTIWLAVGLFSIDFFHSIVHLKIGLNLANWTSFNGHIWNEQRQRNLIAL